MLTDLAHRAPLVFELLSRRANPNSVTATERGTSALHAAADQRPRFSTSEDVYWFAASRDEQLLAAACGLHAPVRLCGSVDGTKRAATAAVRQLYRCGNIVGVTIT